MAHFGIGTLGPLKRGTTPRRFFLARIEGRGLDTPADIEPSGH